MKIEETVFPIPGFGLPESGDQSRNSTTTEKKLPKVVTISSFRDSESNVKPFFERRDKLTYPKDRLHHIVIEGDSEDGTLEALQQELKDRKDWILRKKDFNAPHFKAIVHPGRFRALSKNANFNIQTVLKESDADYVLWIESDLDYPPDIIEKLISHRKDIVAPMIMIEGTDRFYDTYAFRRGDDPSLKGPGGEPGCFQAKRPFHPAYRENDLFEVDSVGSAMFMNLEVLRRGAFFPAEDVIVGFCRTARERGFKIWVDPRTIAWHPMPQHAIDWKEWIPWEETKVTMKYQEKPPVDKTAYELGKPIGLARPLEFAWIAKRMNRERGTSTLDYCAENPAFTNYCALLGLDVTTTDVAPVGEFHRDWMKSCHVQYRFVQTPDAKLPFADATFEQIVALGSVARIKEDTEIAKELVRVCKPKGKIFLSLPYDHTTFWWDHCSGVAPGRYYYDFQSVLDRILNPLNAVVRDLTFIRFDRPKLEKEPYFTHPANSGVIALELEKNS